MQLCICPRMCMSGYVLSCAEAVLSKFNDTFTGCKLHVKASRETVHVKLNESDKFLEAILILYSNNLHNQ